MSWSLCRYVEPQVIREAFKLPDALQQPVGVYANQPNPWEGTHRTVCRAFWLAALAALLVQIFFVFAVGGQRLLHQDMLFTALNADETQKTPTFEIKGKARKVVVKHATNLDNNWIALDMTLVNKTTGEGWPAAQDLSYYYGYDDGESWSEGNRSEEIVFRDVPPGTYYLAVDPELSTEKAADVRDSIEVTTGGAGWSNYLMVMVFLAVFPIFTRLRKGAFEVRRWAESDHAPVASDSDSDSDDD